MVKGLGQNCWKKSAKSFEFIFEIDLDGRLDFARTFIEVLDYSFAFNIGYGLECNEFDNVNDNALYLVHATRIYEFD